ncbi:MAG: hypothetical protein NTW28_36925 [Candidatus Solibacter sp.]|nr:hypothetical protein [Candidatus Solibacter sp.]
MRLPICAFLALVSAWGADDPGTFVPISVFRGDTVTLAAEGIKPGDAVKLIARQTNSVTDGHTTIDASATSDKSIAFAVPPKLSFGRWEISATTPVVIKAIPATIEIKPRVPKIDAVAPKVLYLPALYTAQGKPADDKAKKDNVTVIGSGFVEDKADYYLHFLDAKSPARCDANTKTDCYQVNVSPDRQQITFSDIPDLWKYAGKQRFTVSVGGSDSNASDVTFSSYERNTPRLWALAMLAGILLAIYFILRAGKKNLEHKIDDRSYFLSALFLDKETNTYSLSQCQFYAWTGASILGYIYLATAKSMIQGSMAFPDIPAGLPGILLASAGTTVLVAGISSAKGNKGAGEVHPSLADFIASGGVVAAERLQFVVWTIVGVVTFVRLVFLSDPASIDALPEIPDRFMQLMGISSAGYIGGKLARKAGPTITDVSAVGNASALTVDIKGSGLSQNANFSIGDDVVPPSQIQGGRASDTNLPEIVQTWRSVRSSAPRTCRRSSRRTQPTASQASPRSFG